MHCANNHWNNSSGGLRQPAGFVHIVIVLLDEYHVIHGCSHSRGRLVSWYGAPFVAKLYPLIGDPKAINRLSFCQKSSWFLSKIDSVFIVAKIESVFVLK